MIAQWLHRTILRLASGLVPRHRRGEWLQEWRSELWYIPPHRKTLFCLGSFRDALWLRRNNPAGKTRTGVHLESALTCLAFLGALAVAGILVAVFLLSPLTAANSPWHLTFHDLPAACTVMLALSCLILPATLAFGRDSAQLHPIPRRTRLRNGIFLALKLVLVQPIMLCGLLGWILIARVAPFAQVGILAAWVLVLRWIVNDQRRRCPACLRLLTTPVRIGSSSRTFLEWSGHESLCSHGHGLLRVPETSASYSEKPQWVDMDDSCRELFHAR